MSKFFFLVIPVILLSCNINQNNKSSGFIEGQGIIAKEAMVVSDHPQASRIGAEILKKGGNAVDAAIATGLALAVCYPEAGNIGGGGFMLIRKNDGTVDEIDFREKAPANSSRDMYLDKSGKVIDGIIMDTQLASGVPGSVDGFISAHEKYGKLPFSELIQPAIDLAEKGFPLSVHQANSFNRNRETFLERNKGGVPFVKDSLWKEGDILKQPDLAKTLIRIRDTGRDGFYSGPTADMIEKEMERGNGTIALSDLKAYKSIWREPLVGYYKGYKIITACPPSSGGIIILQLLKMTEKYPLKKIEYHSFESIHLFAEAERRSFADRAEFMGDPDFVRVPVKELLNDSYLTTRMKSFNSDKASQSSSVTHGDPIPHESEQTTHYSVVDPFGNAVSTTTTLNNTFGTSIMVAGAGFLLNNEMDDFSAKPGFPNMFGLVGGEANAIQPGKRMLSSMTPTIIEKDSCLFLVVGSPGGSTIPTTVFQVIVNMIDYSMGVQDAVNAGRFHHQWLPDQIIFEKSAIDSLTLQKLKSLGHNLKVRGSIGLVNAIQILPNGNRAGGADPRGYNVACGF
jgi:gamma-glutamyltranspeptidase/glutathione hydrolase